MSKLSLDNSELVRAVLQVIGSGRDAGNLDEATEADVRHIIRSGLRRFYFPTENGFTYQWRWREKHHPISVTPTFSEGTIEIADGVVTLTDDTWPSWAADAFLRVEGHVVFVTERTSDTELSISNSQLAVDAGTEYEAFRYRYELPEDFAEWIGGVVYANGDETRMLAGSSESEIRLRYAVGQGQNSRTTHFALTSAPDADEFRMVLWPVPEPDAFLQGVYLSVPEDNLPEDLTTPGSVVQVSPIYAEAALNAVLASAELFAYDAPSAYEAKFQASLQVAISHDKSIGGMYDFSHRVDVGRGIGQVLPIDFSEATIDP